MRASLDQGSPVPAQRSEGVGRRPLPSVAVDLRQLECFVTVAEELHFGRAAVRLHLAQPSVSESVRRLERELGGPLFDRTSRHVRLTELGAVFLDEAREALARVRAAYDVGRTVARRPPDQLAVGYALDLGPRLLRVLPQLETELPHLDVALRGLTTVRQLDAIDRRTLHVGVCWDVETSPDRCTLVVDEAPFVAVVPAGHPFAGAAAVDLATVAGEPLIGFPRAIHPRLYDRLAAALDATDRPWSLVGTAVGIVDVAARVLTGQGVGIVFAPEAAARPLDGVVAVPIADGPAVERTLVWRRDERHPAVPRFVALARAELARVD
jgi:DNA-binding transcriptional LysR family regulator